MNFNRVLLAMAVAVVVSEHVGANDLATERAQVLTTSGVSGVESVRIEPVRAGPGIVFEHRIANQDSASIRFRFSVPITTISQCDWSIVISAREEGADLATVWSMTSKDLSETEIWTDEIFGKDIKIQLISELAASEASILLDRIARSQAPSKPLSIVGDNDLAPISAFPNAIKELGRSIAKIKFVGDDGPIYNCTGFMWGKDLMLTNEHCISSKSERQSAIVSFDYDTKIAEEKFTRLSELLVSDHELDYSLVRLSSDMSRPPLKISSTPLMKPESATESTNLIIIQHPGGEPKQVSREDCALEDDLIVGRGSNETDFQHGCDTLGGSSGAPVILLETLEVVGIHHLGFDETSSTLINRAVHINQIIADIPAELLETE